MEFHDVQKILEKVYIYFRQNGKKYVVAKFQDGRTTYKVIVYRETNNPFGNGALAVEQTAWRNLLGEVLLNANYARHTTF